MVDRATVITPVVVAVRAADVDITTIRATTDTANPAIDRLRSLVDWSGIDRVCVGDRWTQKGRGLRMCVTRVVASGVSMRMNRE